MAICTLEQVKAFNSITVATYDALIELRIPTTEQFVHEYTNNNFLSENLVSTGYSSSKFSGRCKDKSNKGYEIYNDTNVFTSGTFTFDSTLKTITSTTNSFADFEIEDNIVIVQSTRNNGFYTITAKASDNEITVKEKLRNGTDTASIALLDYDDYITYIACRMIGYDVMTRDKTQGLKSQSLDAWSESYTDNNKSGYPEEITTGLNRYKMMRTL